jgi:phage terminase large subunit
MQDLTQTKYSAAELLEKFPLPDPDEEFGPETMPYQPHGGHIDLLYSHEPEAVISGPAGTGKTRTSLEKLYILLHKYTKLRVLMVRKTRASLTQSAMVTFDNEVVPPGANVIWRTGEQEYRFPDTGSVLVVGGMDKPSKILSTQYDIIYVPEATELTEEDWEILSTRARNPVLGWNQVFGDCNPGPPTHWIKAREQGKKLNLIPTVHEDNPVYYDHGKKDWTQIGRNYLSRLEQLSGVRYLRLVKGVWAAAEGMIYTEYDPEIHLIYRRGFPADWRRFRVVDFGYRDPFVCQWWVISPDEKLYRYRELYLTQHTVTQMAALINQLSKIEVIETTVCDWDAEDRATLEENGIPTVQAIKHIVSGIQKVQDRLKARELFLLRDSLVQVDQNLVATRKPVSTEDEIDAYIWGNKVTKEAPAIGSDDHGLDCVRYAVEYADMYRANPTGGIYV